MHPEVCSRFDELFWNQRRHGFGMHARLSGRQGVRLARIRVRQRLADLAFGHLGWQAAENWLRLAQRDIELDDRSHRRRPKLKRDCARH